MRRIGTMLTAVLVLVLAAGMAFAQGGARRAGGNRLGGGDFAGFRGGDPAAAQLALLDQLNLTDAQRQQVEELKAQHEKKLEEVRTKMREAFGEVQKFRQDNPDDQEGLRKKREELTAKMTPMRDTAQAFLQDVKAVLNEEQLKKFEQLIAERGPMGGRQGMAVGMGAGLPGMSAQLMEELQLTDQQKEKVKGLMQQYVEEQRQLIEKFQGMIKESLTPEQQEKYEKAMAEAQDRPMNRGQGVGRRARPDRRGGADGGDPGAPQPQQ